MLVLARDERELREIAGRMGCEIVKVYKDHGISGAKARDERPAFDALCRDATKAPASQPLSQTSQASCSPKHLAEEEP